MQNDDLTIARKRLKRKNLALVIAKKGQILFETSSHGIGGLLKAIEQLNTEMRDSSVADKIVGKAAASLCVYAGVAAVFAVTASQKGVETLRENNVPCKFENNVPYILNSKRSDVCPFEKLVMDISDPKEAYERLKALATERRLI